MTLKHVDIEIPATMSEDERAELVANFRDRMWTANARITPFGRGWIRSDMSPELKAHLVEWESNLPPATDVAA